MNRLSQPLAHTFIASIPLSSAPSSASHQAHLRAPTATTQVTAILLNVTIGILHDDLKSSHLTRQTIQAVIVHKDSRTVSIDGNELHARWAFPVPSSRELMTMSRSLTKFESASTHSQAPPDLSADGNSWMKKLTVRDKG